MEHVGGSISLESATSRSTSLFSASIGSESCGRPVFLRVADRYLLITIATVTLDLSMTGILIHDDWGMFGRTLLPALPLITLLASILTRNLFR
jgi:hypothetical protein